MKILFIGNNAVLPDYLHDSVFHGLRELGGDSIIDANKLWYLYKDANLFNDENFENIRKSLHGWGYTYGGNLENLNIDRTNINEKIQSLYFDLIIFGICRGDPKNNEKAIYDRDALLQIALETYPSSKLIFLDGSDGQDIKRNDLLDKGLYFKRENTGIGYPIWFAIPKQKFNFDYSKNKLFSNNIPAHNRKNYVHLTEASYYSDYGESFFALTCKKGGWDCMRHYEIMSQGTLPYFVDIDNAPKETMPLISRSFCKEVRDLIDIQYNLWEGIDLKILSEIKDLNKYKNLMDLMISQVKDLYNTETLAKYIIDTVNHENR
jgi:hypothetical protein